MQSGIHFIRLVDRASGVEGWSNSIQVSAGPPGHRNIYFSGDGGPVLRSNEPGCDTLTKLWSQLDAIRGQEVLAIPHHPANVIMGVDWEQGWNPRYERAVEIHSVWGSSEKHADGRVLDARDIPLTLPPDVSAFVRITTNHGHMAWSSPVWGS